jgi:hypothetical protein
MRYDYRLTNPAPAGRSHCTVSVAAPVTPFTAAEMVAVPDEIAIAFPLLTDATPGFEVLQLAWDVRPNADPSLNVPVAVNCWDEFTGIDALPGVTAMEVNVALVTVRLAVPTCPAKSAEIVVVPACTPVAEPAVLCALLMVAKAGFEDVQVAKAVRSC